MENPRLKWMMTGGTPMFGNLHRAMGNGPFILDLAMKMVIVHRVLGVCNGM